MKKILLLLLIAISLKLTAQSPTYSVYALKFANASNPFPISDWVDKGPKTDSVNIEFMIWLIKGSNGRNILVDAGFLNDMEDAKEFQIVNYHRPDSVLQKLGLYAEDITDIILSHPHWDHIDGISLFPKAQVWMQKEDYGYFTGGAWQKGGDHGGFNKRDVRMMMELNLQSRLTLVDGDDKEIIPGIKVYTGSRHTFNSQYVGITSGNRKIILASDNIWVYYSLDHLMPASIGGTMDPAGYVKAMQRMKTLVSDPKYIIPGHDAKIFKTFPSAAQGVVIIK